MSLYARLLSRVSDHRWFAAVASRLAPRADRLTYRLTRGRRLATPKSLPTLILTTTGRRTGSDHSTPLVFLTDADAYIVVGTNWGRSATPEWALNLDADPRAVIEVPGGGRSRVEAAEIPFPDQGPFWARFGELWPAYATYRNRVGERPIRMFLLSPLASG